MPYWTKGVVTFRASNPNTILINPATDYQVIHDAVKYTIFVGTPNSESKNIGLIILLRFIVYHWNRC